MPRPQSNHTVDQVQSIPLRGFLEEKLEHTNWTVRLRRPPKGTVDSHDALNLGLGGKSYTPLAIPI
jgi:hypothetical protein